MKKVITLLLTVFMLIGFIPLSESYSIQAETLDFNYQGVDSLVPKAQELQQGSAIYTLGDSVNVVYDSEVDADVKKALSKALTSQDILINDSVVENDFTLYLALNNGQDQALKTAVNTSGLEDIKSYGSEAYQIITHEDHLVINASDDRGLFYAVKTVGKVLINKTIEELTITDYPDMTVRGIVEGFYGTPWTTEERIDQFEFYGDMKLNTYIYAPKDDPYHRARWREAYPSDQLERMTLLIEKAKENKVNFVFAISPGIDIDLNGSNKEKDFQALVAKTETLYDMGVRSFAIYFDDIHNKDGVNQAKLLNRFQSEFVEKYDDVEPLITVPTEYDTFGMIGHGPISTYTKDFSETLNDDIHVMWTGSVVVSEELTTDNAKFVNDIYGDNIAIWWNYPVTDYQKQKLALGPIVDIDKGVNQYVDYFLMNPMEHANLSKIALGTGADFSWNTQAYDEDQSWYKVLSHLYGDLAPEMKIFSEHSSRMNKAWDVGRLEAQELQEDILKYWTSVGADEGIDLTSERLNKQFDAMSQAAEKLLKELPANIIAESKGNIEKLGLLGRTAKKALEMNLAEASGDTESFNRLKKEVQGSGYKSGKELSEKVVVAFIDEALNFNPLPTVDFELNNNFVNVNEEIHFTNLSSLVTKDIRWEFPGATIIAADKENPVISYEEEGRYTVKLFGENSKGKDELIKENYITVSNVANTPTENLALNKTTKASSSCAANEAGKFAVDGNIDSKWCANGWGNHNIVIDLGEPSLVTSINVYHAEAGGEPKASNTKAFTLELSNDGSTFTTVANRQNNTLGTTVDRINAQEARYIKLNITKPTQGVDSAARIFEIEVNGYVGSIELPPVYTGLDYSSLQTVYNQVSNLKEENYTPNTWSKLAPLRTEAEALLDEGAKEQSTIDTLSQNLETAYNELVERAEKDGLLNLLKFYSNLKEEDHSKASWIPFDAARISAGEVLADLNASQELVDETEMNFQTSFENLVYIKELKETIKAMEVIVEEDYTEASYQVLTEAIQSAKEGLENDEIVQTEVNSLLASLNEAFDQLEEKEAIVLDFTALSKFIEDFEKLNEDDYTETSWLELHERIEEAKNLLNTAETQKEIDVLASLIEQAFHSLQDCIILDFTEVHQVIESFEALNEEDYTQESYKALLNEINRAKTLLETAQTQEEIEEALEKIDIAFENLDKNIEEVELDTTVILEKIDEFESYNASDYTEKSWTNYKTLIDQAKELVRTAEYQDELDSLVEAIDQAIYNLVLVDVVGPEEPVLPDKPHVPEKPEKPVKPVIPEKTPEDQLPSTGMESNNSLYIIAGLVVVAGLGFLWYSKKKDKK